MSFRKMFADLHPELKEKYASEQYKLAQVIIAKKLALKVSQPVLASLMGVSYDKYLDMENGSLYVSVDDYKLALETIKDLTRTEVEPEFIEKISKFPSFVMKAEKEPVQIMEKASFNIKQDFRNELTLSPKSVNAHCIVLPSMMKELKVNGISEIFSKEVLEDELQAGKMINNAYKKGIEKAARYSFDFKEEFSSEISISA